MRNMVVLAGSVAELQCDTVPVDRNDDVILVLWFRENVGTPIFRYSTTSHSANHNNLQIGFILSVLAV